MASTVIAFVGHPGAGKTSLAAAMVRKYDLRRYAIARTLKAEVARALGFNHADELDNHPDELDNMDPYVKEHVLRPLYWAWGDARRFFYGSELYVSELYRKIAGTASPVIIEDLRTMDEYDYLESRMKLVVVRVEGGGDAYQHPTEIEWQSIQADVSIPRAETPERRAENLLIELINNGLVARLSAFSWAVDFDVPPGPGSKYFDIEYTQSGPQMRLYDERFSRVVPSDIPGIIRAGQIAIDGREHELFFKFTLH